jgi:hypothetical protein
MATNTTNLRLQKDLPTDFYNIETVNHNLDIIDEFAGRKDNPHNVTKSQVGLDKVDNTADVDKPVSTAQSQAIAEAKSTAQTNLSGHTNNKSNPHTVTKAQVGLGNVDNTSDVNKPVSTAQQTALNNKVDKVSGKGLSTNDYTTAEKTKLSGIETGANKYVLPSASSTLGGVKSGGDVTISGGVITVNDNSHAHTIANIAGLADKLESLEAEIGTYYGTGTYGRGKETIINFSRRPKAILLGMASDNSLPNLMFLYGQEEVIYPNTSTVALTCYWEDTSLKFYSSMNNASSQYNSGNGTYYYVVIY